MVNKKSKIFISLIIFSLIFSAWLPTALADDEPVLSEEELLEFCEIEAAALFEKETLEVKEEEESAEIEALNIEEDEEVLEDEEEALVQEIEISEVEEIIEEEIEDEEEIIIEKASAENNPIPAPKKAKKEDDPKEIIAEDPADLDDEQTSFSNSDFSEDLNLKGAMPMIPMPRITPLSNGGGVLEDTIEVDKYAERLKGLCRQYEVTLEITGEPQPAPVDVVLIIDISGSMGYNARFIPRTSNPSTSGKYYVKVDGHYIPVTYDGGNNPRRFRYPDGNVTRYVTWNQNGNDSAPGGTLSNPVAKPFYTETTPTRLTYAKEAAVNFAGLILGPNGIPGSRVSLVTFSGPTTTSGNGNQNQAATVRGLTTSLSQITSSINGISAGGGTNTEAGFKQGQSVIQNATNPNPNKVVVMFTDGNPTASNGNRYAESTDINHIHNQRAIEAGQAIFNANHADVITIGLLQGMTIAERDLALQILNLTQNKGWYEAPTAADLDLIFTNIATHLSYAATNAKVVDKIGEHFDLVQGSLPSGATYDPNTREITWNPGTIVDEKTLTYRVVAKPDFLGGPADTNAFAKLTYTDIFGTSGKIKDFLVPNVNVPSLLEVELTDATIILGDSINLGEGTDAAEANYMNVFGGDGDGTFTYEWRVKGSNTVISTDRNPSVNPTADTIYEVTVRDSNNCIAKAEMTVFVRKLNITIKKVIEGNYANFEDTFNFVVHVDGEKHEFILGHEGEKLIEDIAREATITLTEDSGDYAVVVTYGEDNTVVSPTGSVYTINLGTEDLEILVTNNRTIEVDTGIVLDNMPYVLLLTTTLGFGVYLTIRRRKRN